MVYDSASAAEQSRLASEAAASLAIAAAERAEDIASVVGMEDASLTRKGVVRLSNATDSDSESEAATPKAVKEAMDETRRLNESLAGKQPLNEKLTALSALDTSEDMLSYFSGENTLSTTPLLMASHLQRYLWLTLPHISAGTRFQEKSYGMSLLCSRTTATRAQRPRFTTYR